MVLLFNIVINVNHDVQREGGREREGREGERREEREGKEDEKSHGKQNGR